MRHDLMMYSQRPPRLCGTCEGTVTKPYSSESKNDVVSRLRECSYSANCAHAIRRIGNNENVSVRRSALSWPSSGPPIPGTERRRCSRVNIFAPFLSRFRRLTESVSTKVSLPVSFSLVDPWGFGTDIASTVERWLSHHLCQTELLSTTSKSPSMLWTCATMARNLGPGDLWSWPGIWRETHPTATSTAHNATATEGSGWSSSRVLRKCSLHRANTWNAAEDTASKGTVSGDSHNTD